MYVVFIRSILETSSSVWHKSLPKENENDLERIQKTTFRLILGTSYTSYENAQSLLCLSSLKDIRELLFTKFTLKGLIFNKWTQYLETNTRSTICRPSKCFNHHNQWLCNIFLAGVNLLLQTYCIFFFFFFFFAFSHSFCVKVQGI